MRHLKIFIILLLATLGGNNLYARLQGQPKADSLLKELPRQKEDTLKAAILHEICMATRNTHDIQYLQYGEQSLALSTKLNWKKGMVDAANSIGVTYTAHTNYARALEYHRYALRLAEETGYKKGIYINLMDIGQAYWSKVENDSALWYSTKALQLSEAEKDTLATQGILTRLGNTYLSMGDYPKSLQCFLTVLRTYEAMGDPIGVAKIQLNLGAVYTYIKDYPKALEYSYKSLKMFEEWKDNRTVAVLKLNIGEILRDEKDYTKALEYYNSSLQMFAALHDTVDMATVYWSLGETYIQLKQYAVAVNYGKVAMTCARVSGYTPDMAHTQKCLGYAYLSSVTVPCPPAEDSLQPQARAARLQMAETYLLQGLKTAIGNQVMDAVRDCYELLAVTCKLKGEYKHSVEYYELFRAIEDSILSGDKSRSLMQMQIEYDNNKKEAAQDKKDALARMEMERQKQLRNGFIAGFVVVLLFAGVFFGQRNKIKQGKKQSDELLLNILPAEVAEELKAKGSADAKLFDDVTVLFTDFKGFTALSEKLSPKELVGEINTCFSAFDNIMQKYGVEKIKTIGDAYMAAGGLPTANKTHATDVVKAALEIQDFMQRHKEERETAGKLFFEIRIGVHTGPVVAGIVGIKKFAYDIWGDTVNTASRMESSGSVGKVNISGTTYELVKDIFTCEYRGEVDAKGKGVMKMYFVS